MTADSGCADGFMEIATVCSNTGCVCVEIWVHQMDEMWCIVECVSVCPDSKNKHT